MPKKDNIISDREKGYEVNVPDKCPDKLDKAIEMLGKVRYVAWGFPMFFLYKDQGSLTKGWSAS